MSARLGAKKGCYHSTLVQATQNEPLPIILTGPVMPSRNAQLLGTVYFKIAGEGEAEHYYNIENPTIKAQLEAAPRGSVLYVQATGHGKDPATHTMSIQPLLGTAAPTPAPAPAPPAAAPPQSHLPYAPATPHSAPPPTPAPAPAPAPAPQPGNGFVDHRPATLLAQYWLCWDSAAEMLERAMTDRPSYAEVSADVLFNATKEIAATLFIEWSKAAGLRPLRKAKEDAA